MRACHARRGTARRRIALVLVALFGALPSPSSAPDDALTRLRDGLFAQPFYLVGRLVVQRGETERVLTLRIHYRGPGHVLAKIEGGRAHEANVVLLRDEHMHVYLPAVDLVLELPAAGSSRLFGSDFALDDLLLLGGSRTLPVVVEETMELVGDAHCRRVLLMPADETTPPDGATPADEATPTDEVRLWTRVVDDRLVRLEHMDAHGRRARVLTFGEDAVGPLPRSWTARSFGSRESTSRLHVVLLERDPRLDAELFTIESIRSWR